MSTGTKTPEDAKPRTFDRGVKDAALKILTDYGRASGKKWTKIHDEIAATLGMPIDDKRLTRQDLTAWSNGSEFGNEKFRFVYEFLTLPDVLAHPEFVKAAAILQPALHARTMGRLMARFFWKRP